MYFFNRISQKFGIGLILILIISIHIFIIFANSFVIKYAIYSIEDDATLINRSGMIRGGVQRVVKLELNGANNLEEISNIDGLFKEFLVEDKYKLVDPSMKNFIIKLEALQKEWKILKNYINEYKKDKSESNKYELINQSEVFWYLSEDAMLTLSNISTDKTHILNKTFFIFILDFILIIFVIIFINMKIRKKLEVSSNIDPLTKAYNRNVFNDTMDYELELNKKIENKLAFILLYISQKRMEEIK